MKNGDSIKSKYTESGINKNTYELLFRDYDNIPEKEQPAIENSYIITIIQLYTRFREKDIFSKLLKLAFEKKYKIDFSKIKYNEKTKEYEYEFNGEVYTFDKLSNELENKNVKKELESERRYGQCHEKSIENTKNIIMPKEQYVKLTSFEELERISDMEYLQHVQKIANIPGIDLKVFTTFGKEIVKELEKNAFMLKKDEEVEKRLDEIRKQKLEDRKNIKKQNEIDEEERE